MSRLERVEDANFRCPQCGAPLRVHQEADVLGFKCGTRHTFSANELSALLESVIEGQADLPIAGNSNFWLSTPSWRGGWPTGFAGRVLLSPRPNLKSEPERPSSERGGSGAGALTS